MDGSWRVGQKQSLSILSFSPKALVQKKKLDEMIAAKSLFKLQSSDADQVKEWPADFRRSSNIHDWFLFPCVEPNTEIDPPTEGRWVRLSIGAHPPLVPSWWWWGRSGGRVVCPSVSWSS